MNLGKKLGMSSENIDLVQHEKKRPPTNTKAARKTVTNIKRAIFFADTLAESVPEAKEIMPDLNSALRKAEKVYKECQNEKPELRI